MNVLADESVDHQIVERLRRDGHQVGYIAEMKPGIPDSDVLTLANQEGSILLTADKDFGEMVFRQQLHMHGIVLIRLSGLSSDRKANIVSNAMRQHLSELSKVFTVIMPGMVRIRRIEFTGL
jgi:predicted nuclease of predicted toxin-antitoxin system